ncbi:hypothetical protein SPRA44_330098 [Serratia proteamaculans]|nr:hypothetical protein SPRA44_330098 [Serratia proteamaculans]
MKGNHIDFLLLSRIADYDASYGVNMPVCFFPRTHLKAQESFQQPQLHYKPYPILSGSSVCIQNYSFFIFSWLTRTVVIQMALISFLS